MKKKVILKEGCIATITISCSCSKYTKLQSKHINTIEWLVIKMLGMEMQKQCDNENLLS